MPDFYKCVKECESFIIDEDVRHVDNILKLNDNNVVSVFKNELKIKKSKKEIIEILTSFKHFIISDINNNFKNKPYQLLTASNDNKNGGDLLLSVDDLIYNIELKFGSETNSNVGCKIFNKIFGNKIFNDFLNIKTRKKWQQMMVDDNMDEEKQLQRLSETLNVAIEEFNSQCANKILNEDTLKYIIDNIINNSGTSNVTNKNYLKYVCSSKGLQRIEKTIIPTDEWKIEPINQLNNNKRVIVRLVNKNGDKITFTLTWKNNFKYKNGAKVSSKCGLGSPSWNVNIKVSDEE